MNLSYSQKNYSESFLLFMQKLPDSGIHIAYFENNEFSPNKVKSYFLEMNEKIYRIDSSQKFYEVKNILPPSDSLRLGIVTKNKIYKTNSFPSKIFNKYCLLIFGTINNPSYFMDLYLKDSINFSDEHYYSRIENLLLDNRERFTNNLDINYSVFYNSGKRETGVVSYYINTFCEKATKRNLRKLKRRLVI